LEVKRRVDVQGVVAYGALFENGPLRSHLNVKPLRYKLPAKAPKLPADVTFETAEIARGKHDASDPLAGSETDTIAIEIVGHKDMVGVDKKEHKVLLMFFG
jgi:hypothetical protein